MINLVNGVRMSENKPLYDSAYEHGFHGAIMSDWIACKDAVASINAGMSLIMPYEEPRKQELVAGLKDGTIDAEALNTAAQRIIDLSNRNEAEKKLRDKSKSLTLEQRRQVAYTAALEGCVLLKNDGVLPLAKDKVIVAAGAPFATYFCGGGSSRVQPELPFISVPAKLSELGYRVEYCDAVWGARAHSTMFGNLKGFYDRALEADAIILGVGSNCDRVSEDFDQQDISLSREELVLIDSAVKTAHPVILVVYGGGAVDLSEVKDKVGILVDAGTTIESPSAKSGMERLSKLGVKIALADLREEHLSSDFDFSLADLVEVTEGLCRDAMDNDSTSLALLRFASRMQQEKVQVACKGVSDERTLGFLSGSMIGLAKGGMFGSKVLLPEGVVSALNYSSN